MKGDPVFGELSEEAAELERAIRQEIADQARAADIAAIAECRKELGDPEAPVLPDVLLAPEDKSEEGIRRFAEEADFATVLKQEFSETNLDFSVTRREREGGRGFPDDPDFIPTIRSAMLQAVNANYPATFPDGERFTLVLRIPPGPRPCSAFYPRTRTVDGRTIKEVVPHLRRLRLARTSARPDDLFLYFDGEDGGLFVPGGRTALVPGLGAHLAQKCPQDWFSEKDPKPNFKGQEESSPARPARRCVCTNRAEPNPECKCSCAERRGNRPNGQAHPSAD